MKGRWIYLLTAVMLAVGVCIAEPVVSGAAPLSGDADGYVEGDCALAVYPEAPNKAEEDSFGEDLAEAGVVLDLYRVARAVKAQGYDSYNYDMMPEYGFEIPEHPEKGAWEALAQEAAKDALQGGASGTLVKDKVKPGEKTKLDAGLYLVIARGQSLTNVADYLEEITQKNEETGEETTKLATVAHSSRYTYRFAPQLVSLPTKEAEGDGEANTANPGDWVYDLTVNLKPERAPRFGSLEIVKTFSSYETEEALREPATCVFEITAVLDGEVVYSNVESITFTAAGEESVIVDHIPAGAQVTVKEIYSGSAYDLTVPGDRIETITADQVVGVLFINTYKGEKKKGHGIKNQFVYDENGGWQWYSDPPQEAPGNKGLLPEAAQ